MELEATVLERVKGYQTLSRWEKSELGRDLRRLGLSYGEIMELIDVKKSTLATWCRDVKLTPEQIAEIKNRRAQIPGIPRDTQWRRRAEVNQIRRTALRNARFLVLDSTWAAGVAMSWGEGFKTHGQLGMANADPHALRFFMRWAIDYHESAAGFRAKINLHAENDEKAARIWWSDQLGLPLSDFTKSFVKPDGTGHRKNYLEAGVCLVRLRKSADALHTTLASIQFLKDRVGD